MDKGFWTIGVDLDSRNGASQKGEDFCFWHSQTTLALNKSPKLMAKRNNKNSSRPSAGMYGCISIYMRFYFLWDVMEYLC